MEEFRINHWAKDWLNNLGLAEPWAGYLTFAIDLLILIIISWLLDFIARRIILRLVSRYVRRSKNQYDDIFLEKRVFRSLAHLLPAILIFYSIPVVFREYAYTVEILQKVVVIYLIVMITQAAHKFLKALEYIGLRTKRFQDKPVSSYIQVFLILLYIAAGIFIISTLVGKSATAILTGFGAATAILLLIFRDTILGLVASIQIAGNDMVRLGDWVTMEKYGADGDVIEINLTTVKVRNWDKTITTVPTYAFISDSFKNWRGMQSLGIRRIKRSIQVDLNSIRFVDGEMFERFSRYDRVKEYLHTRQAEIDQDNESKKVNKQVLINGRRMTNVGVFRHYATNYLKNHPMVDENEVFMVRQLQPTENGLPMEIYCFSKDIAWINYEGIQGDIMDHLLAAIPHFDLRVFQSPGGYDVHEAAASLRS